MRQLKLVNLHVVRANYVTRVNLPEDDDTIVSLKIKMTYSENKLTVVSKLSVFGH